MNEACETPIQELLRAVPRGQRLELEIAPTHHRLIPVGVHCHKAADVIDKLTEKIKDYDDAARVAADENCTANEHHCTCVPLLRVENSRLKIEFQIAEKAVNNVLRLLPNRKTDSWEDAVSGWLLEVNKLREVLNNLVVRCDGEEGVRADGSNIDTSAAHALLDRNENA